MQLLKSAGLLMIVVLKLEFEIVFMERTSFEVLCNKNTIFGKYMCGWVRECNVIIYGVPGKINITDQSVSKIDKDMFSGYRTTMFCLKSPYWKYHSLYSYDFLKIFLTSEFVVWCLIFINFIAKILLRIHNKCVRACLIVLIYLFTQKY